MQRNPRFILNLCNLGMACVALASSLLPVYLTTIAETFGGLRPAELGRIPGVLFAGFIVGISTTGPLADRFGAKPFVLGGAAAIVAGLTLIAASGNFVMLLAAAFVAGLGAGILDMVMSPIVSALHIDNRTAALNRLHAFYCVGAIGTLLLASLLLRLEIPWRLVVASFAVIPAVAFLGFLTTQMPPLIHPGSDRQGLRHLLRRPAFLLVLGAIFLVGATEEGMAQWLPAYGEKSLGFPKSTAALALMGFALSMGLGRWLAAHLGPTWTPRRLLLLGATWCTTGFLLGAFFPNPGVALVACSLVGFGCSVLWPTCLALAADTFPHGGATLFAALAAAGNAGCLMAPLLTGYLAELSSLPIAMGLAAGYPLVLALMLLLAFRR